MDTRLDDMSDSELAEWQYAHRDQLESDEGEEVEVEVEAEISPQLSVTISFRLPGAEADAIREAARDAGVSLSEWIREACADALEPGGTASHRRAVQAELRDATRELEALARRLDAAARRGSPAAKRSRKKKAVTKKTTTTTTTRTATGKSSRRT